MSTVDKDVAEIETFAEMFDARSVAEQVGMTDADPAIIAAEMKLTQQLQLFNVMQAEVSYVVHEHHQVGRARSPAPKPAEPPRPL